jgi:pimeloyl-ACP methyl ester carboxylesterase
MPAFCTSDGTRIAYTDDGAGRPIVFTHSWALDSDQWDYVMARLLDADVRCVAYDRRGHGRSGRARLGASLDTYADDLAALLEHLDLRDVTLVGHSFGCCEITHLLSRHGDGRVGGVVFVAPITPFLLQTDDNPDGAPPAYVDGMLDELRSDVPAWCERNAPPFWGDREVSAGMTSWVTGQIVSTPVRTLVDTMRIGATTDLRAEVAAIAVPTTIVHGDRDASAVFELTGRKTADLVDGCRLVVRGGAGHGLYVTDADVIAAEILDLPSR